VVTALALARAGLEVRLFEADNRVNEAPRAASTHPSTLEMLDGLGLINEVLQQGLKAPTFQFRERSSGELIAEFDHLAIRDDTPYPFVVQLEQHKLANIAIEQLRSLPNARVQMSARVTSLELRDNGIQIEVKAGGNTKAVTGSYLIGADGGRSTVRKLLGIDFEGLTFPERFLVVTTSFDFAKALDCAFRNFFFDPEEWVNLFKVRGSDDRGAWRVVFPTKVGETDEEALSNESIQRRLQSAFPRSGAYPIVHRNIYHVHQRLAATFQKGRTFLAGDAAHVNNPLGGLGLNCGIHDAVDLASRLIGVLRDQEPPETLSGYDQCRRPINIEYVQRQSIANKRRLEEKDVNARRQYFTFLRKTAADPRRHRAFLLRTSLLDSVREITARQVSN